MGRLKDVQSWLEDNLGDLIAEHEAPGAAVAVSSGDEVVDAAAGVLNLRTGVPATADSLFQIGSVTKIWTSSLVMQLVDEGVVELDAPVRSYLPDFRLADAAAGAAVTVRQLLNHTSGFEGDLFVDTGRGDDAVRRFVEDVMPDAPQNLPPGELFAYNNAGFIVLGRLIEVLRGTTWAQALHTHLAEPLGVTAAVDADEAILHRAAVGHIQPTPDDPWSPTPQWALPHSNSPAGAMLSMSARDMLAMARMHLNGGLASDGARVLSQSSVDLMRRSEAKIPRRTVADVALGLGWHLFDWPGGPVFGHDGNTIGQAATLRIVPGSQVAVAILANGGNTPKLFRSVHTHILAELAGVDMPPDLAVPAPRIPVDDPTRYVGSYQGRLTRFDVEAADGKLWITTTLLA
ncbi:MAG: serine hydrolase domain-containing protein, partial [Stackebrandtia sp.]